MTGAGVLSRSCGVWLKTSAGEARYKANKASRASRAQDAEIMVCELKRKDKTGLQCSRRLM